MLRLYNIITTISPLRVLNFIALLLSYIFKLHKNHKRQIIPQPFSITLELSSTCNLHCLECPTGQGKIIRKRKMMTVEIASEIINRHSKTAFVTQLFFQGEPLLNPNWEKIVNLAGNAKLFTIINTNGSLLNTGTCLKILVSKLNRIIISLDGATAEVYNQYRKSGNFNVVIQSIERLVKLKKSLKVSQPEIFIQSLLTKETEDQIPILKDLGKRLGVDKVIFKTMQLSDLSEENRLKWLPKKARYSRYAKKAPPKVNPNCWRALSTAVYTTDGDLVPCCFDKMGDFNFGNVLDNAWNSTKRKNFLFNLANRKIKPKMCHNCTNTK